MVRDACPRETTALPFVDPRVPFTRDAAFARGAKSVCRAPYRSARSNLTVISERVRLLR